MGWTYPPESIQAVALDSLFGVSTVYTRRSNGDLQYNGKRPRRHWHAHGWYLTEPTMPAAGHPVQIFIEEIVHSIWSRHRREMGLVMERHHRADNPDSQTAGSEDEDPDFSYQTIPF